MAYKLSSIALSPLEIENETLTKIKKNIPGIEGLNHEKYLWFKLGYQKFGTQFMFDDQTGEILLAPIDTTFIK